jgi:pilus assembly protein TadC
MTVPDPSNSPAHAPTIIIASPPRASAIRAALSILGILFALFLGLLVLIVIGIETGPVALMLGFITATIPVPLYVILVRSHSGCSQQRSFGARWWPRSLHFF